MKWLTKELLKKLPLAKVAYDTPDPVVWVHLYCIDSGWSYYICGYDPGTNSIWGLKDEREAKLGSLLLDELDEVAVKVLKELDFLPCRLSDLIQYLSENEGMDEVQGWSY